MNKDLLHDFFHVAVQIKCIKQDIIKLEHIVTTLYNELEQINGANTGITNKTNVESNQ